MKNCVNTSHKEFKELARKLDIDDSSLELIIYKFQNADSNNVNVFPSEEYIKDKLTGVNRVTSKAQVELWKRVYNKDFKFNNSEDLNKAIETAENYFNSEAVTVWVNREGNYVMRVATPENIKEDLQDTLDESPINSQGRFSEVNNNIYKENISGRNAATEAVDIRLELIRKSPNTNLGSVLSILKDSEYAVIINLLQGKFGNRDEKLLEGVQFKFIDPLSLEGGHESPTMKLFGGRRAYYNASTKTIYVNTRAKFYGGNSSAVLMHELMHAITVAKILSNPELKAKFEQILEDYQKEHFDIRYAEHKKHRLEEFIANIWSDPKTINNLKNIKSKRLENKSIWEEIKIYFKDILNGLFGNIKNDSLFAEASAEMVKLLESPSVVNSKDTYINDSIIEEKLKEGPRILKDDVSEFLSNFGITLEEASEYEGYLFDDINRIIYASSPEDITEGVGYAVAFMMQHHPEMRTLIAHKINEKNSKGFRRSLKVRGDYDSLRFNNVLKDVDSHKFVKDLGHEIARELRKLYNIEEINKEKDPWLSKLWEVISEFFELLTPLARVRFSIIKNYSRYIANSIVLNDKSIILSSDHKPGSKEKSIYYNKEKEIASLVLIPEALKENPYEENIITILNNEGIALAGSASIAIEGSVYRPIENPLHDIDFEATNFNKEQLQKILNTHFPNNSHIRSIVDGPNKVTETFLVIDRPFTIGEGEMIFTEESKKPLFRYPIFDKETGELIGNYIKSELVLKEGIQGKFLDFFTGFESSPYGHYETTINGKKYLISDAKNAIRAKVEWARVKDIWDYSRFIPNTFKPIIDLADISKKEENKKKLQAAKIIWGHPAIGKTYYLETHNDIIEWDALVNEDRDNFIRDQVDPEHKLDMSSEEYSILRSNYMHTWKEHPEYIKFYKEKWEWLKEKAKKENKRIFASPGPLIELFEEDFDVFINIPEKEFLKRDQDRGSGYMHSLGWKMILNEYLVKVPKNKIIMTDKYFSELMEETYNEESIYGEEIEDFDYSGTIFTTSKTTGYRERTIENAEWSDVTLALAVDFTTAGEKLTKKSAGKKYVNHQLAFVDVSFAKQGAEEIFKDIKRKKLPTKNIKLNIAGNGIYSLDGFMTQDEINDYTTSLLKELMNLGVTISSIRSGGQTGADEAGIIAAQRLGIPNEVHTTKDWKFRGADGKDIKSETAFKSRFQNNKSYNISQNKKTYSGLITSLKPNQIFVFGSNTQGRHGAGAAKTARDKFGAKYGQAEGIQGQSYAIITKDLTIDDKKNPSRTKEQIIEQIHGLYEYAKQHSDKEFLVAYSKDGKNLNYYSSKEMAKMFASKDIPSNIIFEEGFYQLVEDAQEELRLIIEQLNKSKNLVAKIISDSKENIKKHPNFDKEDVEGSHTYLIKQGNDWIPADSSVTQLVHGNINLGGWRLPSMKLGNTTDRFVRRYFELSKDKKDKILKEYFPNLTKEQALDLKKDLDKLSDYFDKKFNGNWGVETREFPIAGKYAIEEDGKLVYKTVAGTMDMLIYDGEGNFYIYDFKTVRSNLTNKKLEGYYQQLSIYKAILEANYPDLRGKIKEMDLIRFSLYYETPIGESNGTMEYEKGEEDEDKDILLVYDESIDSMHYIPIENTKWYQAPRLYIGKGKNSGINNAFYTVPDINLSQQFKSLTEEEKIVSEEFKEEYKVSNQEVDELSIQMDSLYNNPLLTATERMFLANTVMYYTSNIITHLQSNPEANATYLIDTYSKYDFTKMSRQEIIDTVGINSIFKYIKDTYFNSALREDIEDWDLLDKLDIAYNNWEALTRSAYSKLITLEGVTVSRTAPEYITKEGIEDSLMESQDTGALEENEREYWQLGIRHISTKSSLSNEVRRVFERLVVTDQNGNPVLDKYGYNFHTFIDSNEAVNKILDWCQDCTTIEEMEESIRSMSESNPWVNGILNKIQEEPFRSQFFQNFRKDFTQYSIITVDRDNNGNKSYKVLNINTKGASKVILDGVTTAYREGLLTNIIIPIKGDIEGRGKVNVKEVEVLSKSIKSISKTLHSSFGTNNFTKTINSQIPEIAKALNKLGVSINIQTLKDAFSKDSKLKNEPNTNYFKVLSNIEYMLDTLMANKTNTEYNPLEKGSKGNIYGNYKNIVTILSKYIQDSIEASTYENGKMHYSFVTPSYMGKLITNLKDSLGNETKFRKFMQEEYKQYRWFYDGQWNNEWLRLLNTSGEMRQKLEHKVQLSFDGTPYNELSELGYTLSLMHEYFYDNAGKKNLAWYRVPILANKPSSEFIRFKRYSGRRYQRDIINGLSMVATQEIMRIKTVLERSQNSNIQKIGVKEKVTYDIKDDVLNNTLNKKIQNGTLTFKNIIKDGQSIFKGSGAEFKFLPALNQELVNKTTLGQLILDKINGKEVDESLFEKEFNSAIKSYMKTVVAREINNWRQLGLFDTIETKTKVKGKNITNVEYRYLKQFGKTEEEILDALEEYVWNDMFATINIIQLTATDLAYYKNIEDFQKRYAQVHSPSLKLNVTAKDSKGNLYSKDGKERTIYLKDFVVTSEIIPQVTAVFDNKISKLSGVEKQHMKMMKDLIIQSFKEVNVADAQGYSSPTSYRKKMGMAGRWTTDMEEAYQRIVKGDFNVNDLGIVWQPLKPFVYSQIPKSTGATTMNKIKLAVQNKNSEYLLILADALMRGGNKVSKLTAIFDFMEDSAYDGRISKDGKVIKEGVYNGIGIDTIQFESAVNSGSMGAIDINNLDSYDAIKEELNRHVYYNTDHSESMDNDMDRYNDQFVHAISFEDYGIQQEVPAHLVDHEQPMGSQIRILSISDITPGTKFNVRGESIEDIALIKEYQNLIAENIKDSFKQLAEDFNITGTRIEKNIALSKLLVEAIEKDQRYGVDLLRACSLNPITKEFNIPLNDPSQSTRIQQLINSIIKTRINKQKVPGGPVVQASVFGMSDDLEIVWKDEDKGIVDYFECYMPIPSAELEKALTKYDENGHAYFMSIEEAIKKGIITEEMTKAIGYRIPTEDKYSMAPLKIKGFLPKAAGEAIMLPKEITTLAGSDFDIDKMYIMLKAFKVNKPKADFNLIENAFKSYLTSQGKSKKEISNYIHGNKNTGESSIREYISKIEAGVSFSINTQQGTKVDEKGLAIERWYNANKDRIYTKHSFIEEMSLETREGRSNRIFDLQWAVLTNEDTMDKLFNPGSFDVQKKSARIVNILKYNSKKYTYKDLASKTLKELDAIIENQNDRSIILSSTQVYFHKQNMTAGKLIGIFANNNTSHAFLSLQDISFNIDNEFMFNEVYVSNEQNNRLDLLRGEDGSLISKTIAGFLAASVDAVKDPVLNYMNLNTFTAGPAMVLARLGFNSDSIGLFLSQPIIEIVTREYFKRSNEGYVSISDIIDDFLPEDPQLIKGIKDSLSDTPFTMEDMAEGIHSGLITDDFQRSVLVLFKQLSEMAQDLNTLTFITKFNSITNAVGPTIADTLVMRERYEKFIDNMNSDNPPFTINAKYVLKNSPILEAFYNTTLSDGGASKLIFQEYFPHYSSMFTQILQALRNNTKGNLDSKIINKLINDFMLYKMTIGDDPVLDSSIENRKRFMLDFPQEFLQRTSGIIDNDLLKVINLKSRDYKCPVPTLEARTGSYSIDVQERVKAGWGNLVINPETKELGRDLLYYNIFRSGFNFSPKTFGHLASVDVKLNIPGYVSILQDIEFNDDLVNIENFIYMFLRNHTDSSKLVPELRINKNINVSYEEDTVTIEYKDDYGVNSILVSNGSTPIFAKVISINDVIYMNPVLRLGSVVYTKTTTLGITNNFLEYDGNSSANMSSIFKSKQVIKKEPSKSSPIEEDRKNNYVKPKDVEAVLQKELGLKEYQLYKAQPASERQGFINKIVTLTLQQVNANTKNENLREVVRKKVVERLKELNVC